ncbi:MAG: hypothetical protein IID51_13665 [Proteobacteria bacterium]|nr:hypothetical protein [Pseudomonadota bacterium]
MKAFMSLADVDSVKKQLGHLVPNVKSSHRAEAMARALGWRTNSALRSDLALAPRECEIDNIAFNNYLEEHSFADTQYGVLGDVIVAIKFSDQVGAIEDARTQEPNLTRSGFAYKDKPGRTQADINAEIERDRKQPIGFFAVEEFMRACEFLSQKEKRTTINKDSNSYGLKHEAERFHKKNGASNPYVSNGMFIAAAIHLGFKIKKVGPNAYLNISSREPGERKQGRGRSRIAGYVGGKTRVTAWRNLMIAGINAGLKQGVFGLGVDQNYWEGDGPVYRFVFADLPAIASVSDAGHGELLVKVAVEPTKEAERFIPCFNAGLAAGEAFASGYLERKNGKWLQTPHKPCNAFRRDILPIIAEASQEPDGYDDHGRFMM